MIETVFNILPDWAQNKVVVRMFYTASSFTAARTAAFLTGDYLATLLALVMKNAGHVGIHLKLQVVSVDVPTLQTFLAGTFMVCGEYFIEKFHEKKVIPVVTEKK